jgi:negative regulator of sigma E activity
LLSQLMDGETKEITALLVLSRDAAGDGQTKTQGRRK